MAADDDEDSGWSDRRVCWFRRLTVLAVLISVFSLFVFDWWPSDFVSPTLLDFRTEALSDPYQDGLSGYALAYLEWGIFVQLVGLLLFAVVVFLPRRWWLPGAALAILTTVWQLSAMVVGELIHTTVSAWLCPISVGLLLLCWLSMRTRLPEPTDSAG